MVVAVPLVLLAGFIVAYGLSISARRTSHAVGAWLIRGVGLIPLIGPTVSDAAIALTRYVTHELGEYAKPAGQAVVRWLSGLGGYIATVGYWSLLWPKELFTFAYWLLHSHLPRVLHGATAPVIKIVHGTVKIVRRVETRVVHVTKTVYVTAKAAAATTVPWTLRQYLRELEWIRRHWKALTAAVAAGGAIALPFPRIGVKPREWTGVLKRLKRLEKVAAGLGTAGLVLAALRRLRLGWLRCSNVGKVGRRLCGLDGSLLDSLLLDTVAILSVLSVVEFAEALLAVEDEAVKVLAFGIREFPAV